jgi:hypothetical protein
VLVRWRVSDVGNAQLHASVDYAADGRHFTTLIVGLTKHSVKLPASLFGAGKHARIRVRVSDGFNESVALSPRFRALGHKPSIQLQDPTPGERVVAGASLYMKAEAFDDHGRPLTGGRVRWFVDGKPVGTGEQVSVTGLAVGDRAIKVSARAASGRTASRTVHVEVVAAPASG